MDHQITIEYPETLAFSLKMQTQEFEREIKTLSLVKLYELGKISSGIAAKILGITRVDFLDILASYKVSTFADTSELESDFSNA
jgi:predicted HTH domain antitoxin